MPSRRDEVEDWRDAMGAPVTERLVIREAQPADIEGVLALWQADDVAPSRTDDADGLKILMDHPTSTLLVAVSDARIVGSVIAAWNGWRGALYRLAVAPTHRRAGVATALVRAAEERLIAQGARRLHALVLDDAEDACAFWLANHYDVLADVSLFSRNDP
jgi:ribosomal protein S18 acetylase RimI-like enzyme